MTKNFMSGLGGNFGGGGASGSWVPDPDQSAAETARLARQAIKGHINNQSPAETARLNRAGLPKFSESTNNYSHEANNVVTSSKDAGLDLNIKIQPNILDNYDAVTYHWKLFITDPATSTSGNILDTSKQTIIAETSVTDLTIDKVTIRGVTTPSVEGGTGMSTRVKFEITEPGGAGLLDKLFYQAISLGIGNWVTMPVYLQLQFRNRKPDTSEVDDDEAGLLANLKWVWTLTVTDIKANVTASGTRYDFDTAILNEIVQSNAHFTLQHNTVLNNLDNFESAMKELQEKLNEDQLQKLLVSYSIPDSFRIVVDPKIAPYKVTPVDKNTNPVRHDNYVTFGLKDASFSSGTAIDKVIDSLLAQTEEYQVLIKNSTTPPGEGVPMNQEVSQMKKFWRIVTEVRPLQFDALRQTTAKEFIIYIIEYDLGILDANVFQTSAAPTTLAAQKKRLAEYIKKSIIKKKYNYIFTGLNDQILDFDLTLNNAFAQTMSRFGGIYQNTAMFDKGLVTHNHSSDESKVLNEISAAISLQNNASTVRHSDNGIIAKEKAAELIKTSDLPAATKQRFSTILNTAKSGSRMSFLKAVQARGGIDNDGTLSSVRAKAVNLAKPLREKITNRQFNFISDIDINSQAAKSAYTELMKNSRAKLRPIARIESMQDRQVGAGVESNSNSGLQKLSNMYSVALHAGIGSTLQQIRLKIKGDPFWIFPAPVETDNISIFQIDKGEARAIELLKRGQFLKVDYANFYGTDNFLIVIFRTPRIYNVDENPDSTDPNTDVETFSGVYKVVEATSSFGVGKFEQELLCNLDEQINILDFSDQIKYENSKKDIPTEPKDLKNTSSFPKTSIKTPKINGLKILTSNAQGLASQAKGIASQARDLTGQIKTLGSQTVGDATAKLASNIPTPIQSLIPGLPPRYNT